MASDSSTVRSSEKKVDDSRASAKVATLKAGIIYEKKEHLAEKQIRECDLIFTTAVQRTSRRKASKANLDDFWDEVFRFWKSTRDSRRPIYVDRQFDDYCLELGVFKTQYPPNIMPDHDPEDPAFLKVQPESIMGTLSWCWIDRNGEVVNESEIARVDNEPLLHSVRDVVMHYDITETARLTKWNSNMAVYIVREKIRRWTKKGYPAVLLAEKKLLQRIERAVLCSDILNEYGKLIKSAKTEQEDGQKGSTFKPLFR